MRPLEPGMPGVLAVHVSPGGDRRRVAECASCGALRPIRNRGLCGKCTGRHRRDGTIGEFGWTKTERLAEYATLRAGLTQVQAAARVGVSTRTATRYEAALRQAGAS